MSRLREAMDAVRANPKNAGAWVTLGEQLGAAGQIEKATQSFQRALQLDPTNSAAQRGLAQILLADTGGNSGASTPPPSAPMPRATAQNLPALPPAPTARRESPSPRPTRIEPEPISAPRSAITREEASAPRRTTSRPNAGAAMEMRTPPPQAIKPTQGRMMAGILFLVLVPLLCLCALVFALAQWI
jgi:hypothetical protein